jgi:hypothetical protein
MNDQSQSFPQMTLWENAPTSSPGSAGGSTRYNSPDGLRIGLCGLGVARASRSAPQASGWEQRIPATYGQSFDASSPSAVLQRSLENKLPQVMRGLGSPLYALTWRRLAMPSGPPVCLLRASVLRTSDTGYIGVPTPLASDWKDRGTWGRGDAIARRIRLGKQIGLSMLFDGKSCPSCVAGMMGFPEQWPTTQPRPTVTPSSRKSRRRSSERS